MAIHTELRPDDASLALLLADAALRQSNANVTRISGILSVDNGDGSETWIGGNVNPDSNGGVTEWVGDTTVPGRPTGLSAVSAVNRVLVSWNGTLHDGVPADFDHISVFVVNDGTVESLGDLNCAGTILSKKYAEGTILEVYAVAYDAARDERGNYSPNMSEESDRITLVVEQDVDMGQLNNAAADMEQKADEAAAKADKVRSDLQAEVDKVSAKADDLGKTGDQLAGQITDIKGTVNGQRTQLTEFGQKLEGEITRGDTTVKSVTELKQTVNGLSSTVSQTTKTASAALSKATSVEQTANGLKATISKDYQTTKQADGKYSTKAELSATSDSLSSKITETTKTANGAMDKASSVEQTASGLSTKIAEQAKTLDATVKTANEAKSTADSNKQTISQVASTADGAVSRVSSLEQNLNGFKTSVAKTYQTKGDYPTKAEVQSRIDQSASSIKSTVGQTYTTLAATEDLRKSTSRTFGLYGASGKAAWVKLGHLTSNGDASSVLLHVYSGDGYNGQASQNAEFEIFVKDGWQQSASATGAFGVSVSRIRNADDVKVKVMAFSSTTCDIWAYTPWPYWNGHYTLQGNYKSWQDGPNCGGTRIQDAEPTSGTAQDLAYDTLSTRSYVDQTAKSVALGVVQNYQGSDGSGLATKSDITAAKASITSTVASTYATKTGVTQEISSKITQNNNSLDVKFSTKVETQNAQNKANTADSHATDAQSRVGSLEDCINFTASGVRVGKRSNGKFTGVSALVNTNGTFDLLDASGNLLTRINRHRFQVTGDDGTGSGYLSLSQDGINITVQPTADTSKTYHIQVGKSGVGITAPDGARIECSASGGLNIETVKFGKIAIGSGGLQFTNDQGWGLKLSAAGWSIKWAGNHTLATGPKAGALYIDGREIVTR